MVLNGLRVRCPRCGTVTAVAADRAGLQLLECLFGGVDGAVCAYPPGTAPPGPAPRISARAGAADRAVTR